MAEYPVCSLLADEAISNPKVINKQTLNEYIYVSIPPHIACNCALYGVCEVCPKFVPLDYADFIILEGHHPWVRVKSNKLNLSIGLHVYELKYVDTSSNATFSLHFAYILQDNDPDKPYIYMDRED